MTHSERITCRLEQHPQPEPDMLINLVDYGEPYVVTRDADGHLLPGDVLFVTYGSYIRFPGGLVGKTASLERAHVRPLRRGEKVVIEAVGKVVNF